MENASKALVIAGAILISILLITIGIVLVNSGKGVTETGAANMNSQKIQAFNSQFTPYEGKKKGSEIRSLVNLVNASNAADPEHCVSIFSTNTTNQNISNSESYNVTIKYATSSTYTPYGGSNTLAGPAYNENRKIEAGYVEYIVVNKIN